jgi:hypothetical protein
MVYPLVQYVGPAHATEAQVTRPTAPRELDARNSDGIHVRLLWHSEDDNVTVAVNDTKTGETFNLPVHDGQPALDVFHHPYAYAAMRQHDMGNPCAVGWAESGTQPAGVGGPALA